jgi:hypothetical protein
MREQPRRDFQPTAKRQWVKPVIRKVELTDEVLRLFGSTEPIADALAGCDGPARASGR